MMQAVTTVGVVLWFAVWLRWAACVQDDLDALNKRVLGLYQQGDYAGAATVAEQAVKAAERQFGKDAVETATMVNNLAFLYVSRGQYALAEPLLKRALAVYEKSFRPDRPSTATSLNNLPTLEARLGRFSDVDASARLCAALFDRRDYWPRTALFDRRSQIAPPAAFGHLAVHDVVACRPA